MKKIAWITPDYYLDVDMPIVNQLQSFFNITWIVVLSHNSTIDYYNYIKNGICLGPNLTISYYQLKNRTRSLSQIKSIKSIINLAKCQNPDLFYISYNGIPYGVFLYKLFLPMEKCVVACHNVTTPKGATTENIARIYCKLWLSTFKNIQVFSNSQFDQLNLKYKNKNILNAPLAIKDYGKPSKEIDKLGLSFKRFLFFGNILPYKRLDLLIHASQKLWTLGYRNFRVRIAGNCKNWESYKSLIKYPELFELDIRRIPNEEIANLFVDSHFFVMPYQDIAQSGAITVAFRYNLPPIVSNIQQFNEFVVDGDTGMYFETENSDSLANKMKQAIEMDIPEYLSLCKRQQKFTNEKLSLESIVSKYISYLNRI